MRNGTSMILNASQKISKQNCCGLWICCRSQNTRNVDKVEKIYLIYNGVIPKDVHVHEKKPRKSSEISISQEENQMTMEIEKCARLGAMGSVTKRLVPWVIKIDLKLLTQLPQKPILVGTARILRKWWICKKRKIAPWYSWSLITTR